jgi:hypothetical protein
LGSLMVDLQNTFDKPNENLQISFAGIGDAKTDAAPLQVTHFESDNRFAKQLQKIWLEGHGGANGAESYNLLWWYAANKTHLNYVKQDGRKGILITIGDDNVHPSLTANEIQMWLDPTYDGGDISNQVLLNAAREQYDVYHIVITDGQAYEYDYLKKANKNARQKLNEAKQWTDLLGSNNVLRYESHKVADAIAEIIKRHRPLEKENTAGLVEKEWDKQNKENLSDEQWEEVLRYTLCPLTREFMNHPVNLGSDKKAYERDAIETYVREHKRDPMTHSKLTFSKVVFKPNLNIAQLCLNYKPFFEALSESRREHLIELALKDQMPDAKREKTAEISASKSPHILFPNNESEQASKQLEQVQLRLECPIRHEIMEDPVILAATGQTYEREAIEEWLEKNNTDPLTRKPLESKMIIPNYALKSLCDDARSGMKLNS